MRKHGSTLRIDMLLQVRHLPSFIKPVEDVCVQDELRARQVWVCRKCAYPSGVDGQCAECGGAVQPQSPELLQDCRELGERGYLLYPLAFEFGVSLIMMTYLTVLITVSMTDHSQSMTMIDPRVLSAVQTVCLLTARISMLCLVRRSTWGVVLSPVGIGAVVLAALGWLLAIQTGQSGAAQGPDWLPFAATLCMSTAIGLAMWDGASRIGESTKLPLGRISLIVDLSVTVGIAGCVVLLLALLPISLFCFPVIAAASAIFLVGTACSIPKFTRIVQLANQARETARAENGAGNRPSEP